MNRPLVIRGLLKNSTGLEKWFYKLHSLNFITLPNSFLFSLLIFLFYFIFRKTKIRAKPEWWVDNYSEEEVLCGTLSEVIEDCTIRSFFKELKAGKPFYISGASNIFDK